MVIDVAAPPEGDRSMRDLEPLADLDHAEVPKGQSLASRKAVFYSMVFTAHQAKANRNLHI